MNIFRWIFFVPISYIASQLLQMAWSKLSCMLWFSNTTYYVLEYLSSLSAGFLMIYLGYLILPSHKIKASLIYTVTATAAAIFACVSYFLYIHNNFFFDHVWPEIGTLVSYIPGVWIAFAVIRRKEKNRIIT